MPLTYFVYEGNKVDCKAIQKVTARLKAYQLNIAGAILDRGFCTKDCIEELSQQHIPFEIMMTSNTEGYNTMMSRHADEIFNHAQYMLESTSGRYGITDNNIQIMEGSGEKACIALFYDDNNSAGQRTALIKGVLKEKRELIKAFHKQEPCDISDKYANYLEYDPNEFIRINRDALEVELHRKGYSAICSSEERTAREIDEVYNLRDTSENVFMQVKSQLGYDAIRGHTTESILNRFFACFVGCILRTEMVNACQKHDLDTNVMIAGLDNVEYEYNGNRYEYSSGLTKVQKQVFSEFELTNDSVALLVDAVNDRLVVDANQINRPDARVWTMPKKKKRGRKTKGKVLLNPAAEDSVETSAPNCKMGGKLNNDLECETFEESKPEKMANGDISKEELPISDTVLADTTDLSSQVLLDSSADIPSDNGTHELLTDSPAVQPIKRGRGRPPGSKNKKTLLMEKARAEQEAQGITVLSIGKSSRGRPKSLATLQREEEEREWLRKAEIAQVPVLSLPKRPNRHPTKEEIAEREHLIREWKTLVEKSYFSRAAGTDSEVPT